jgi:hypothetical protein
VFSNSMTEMEIVVEHGSESERDRLRVLTLIYLHKKDLLTFKYIYDVGGVLESGENGATDWASRSSNRMPPGKRQHIVKIIKEANTNLAASESLSGATSRQKEGNG